MRHLLLAALPLALMVVPARAADHAVDITGFAYSPSTVTVAVGDVVTWTNRDPVAHTVTSDTGRFDSGQKRQGDTFPQKFETAGSYPYHCAIHSSMRGSVVVQAAGGSSSTTSTTRPSTTTTTRPTATTTTTTVASTTTTTTEAPTTTTTAVDESTTTTEVAAAASDNRGGDNGEPSHAAATAMAALLLAAVSGGAAFAVKRGL